MKWGQLYGPEYVNRLYAMVRANVEGPLRFVCLTDERAGIRPEVECHDCPEIALPAPHNRRGWRKLTTYAASEQLFGLTGQWLFLDLDVVVLGSLDEFFSYQPEKSFIVMRNWTQPGRNIGNTSVYRFTVGADEYLLKPAEPDAVKATVLRAIDRQRRERDEIELKRRTDEEGERARDLLERELRDALNRGGLEGSRLFSYLSLRGLHEGERFALVLRPAAPDGRGYPDIRRSAIGKL